ncbi:MAG: hypothetical protein ACR2PF_05230 [Rhizobiaceae bacterium]
MASKTALTAKSLRKLGEAHEKCLDARRAVREGRSPAKERQLEKQQLRESKSFGQFSENWVKDSQMADSTKAMRRTIQYWDIAQTCQRRLLHEIEPEDVRTVCL